MVFPGIEKVVDFFQKIISLIFFNSLFEMFAEMSSTSYVTEKS